MDSSQIIDEILKERDLQTTNFIDKVQERNKKEALLIAAKYDLKHSFVEIVMTYEGNLIEMVKAFGSMLTERKEFLDLFSSYL
jgi:hypothetical protein